ncbi:MAG: response regulator transcription factor, partial [Gemmatimonadales bacterium]
MARVLLVEDQQALRSLLCRGLSHAGHNVLETADLRVAFGLVGLYRADVVITDVMLSGQDGIALLLAIRRSFPTLALIAISGRDRDEDLSRLEVSGLRDTVWLLT